MACSAGPDIVESGLVLALDAADRNSYPGSGTTWTDLSGNGNNGTLVNGVGYNSANGGSLSFDGVNDNINCGNPSILNPTSSFTLSCWFEIKNTEESDGQSKGLVGKYNGGGDRRQFMLYYNATNNTPAFIVSKDGTNINDSTIASIGYSPGVSREVWYNIAGVFTVSQKMELFLNGELVVSKETPFLTQVYNGSPENFTIGTNTINFAGAFSNSNISLVNLYNRALSASEIQQNFNMMRGRFGI